jgi:hypothetical protein
MLRTMLTIRLIPIKIGVQGSDVDHLLDGSLTVIMPIIPIPHVLPLQSTQRRLVPPTHLIPTQSPNCTHKTNDGTWGSISAATAVPQRAAPRLGWVKRKPHVGASVLRRGVQLWCVGAEVWEELWWILFKSKAQRFPQVLSSRY